MLWRQILLPAPGYGNPAGGAAKPLFRRQSYGSFLQAFIAAYISFRIPGPAYGLEAVCIPAANMPGLAEKLNVRKV